MKLNCAVASFIVLSLLTNAPQRALASSPSYQAEMSRGLSQMAKKDYESAVASFTQVLMYSPDVYEAYMNRAMGRVELKDYEGALADYNQAIKINPNVVECYIKRGNLQLKMNDVQGAIGDYTQALRLNPKNGPAFLSRAQAHKQNGDYIKAVQDYTAALNLMPSSLEAMQDRADCRVRAGDYDGAVADYEFLLKKYKTSMQPLHYNLGEVLALKGEQEAAREHFLQAIDYHSKNLKRTRKNGADFLQRGLAYSQIGETDKAISDLQEAVAWKSDDANAQYHLGKLLLAKGDNKGAIGAFDDALGRNPRMSDALMGRAKAYINEGDYGAAQKDLDMALSGEKTAEGYLERAITRTLLGDSSGAVSDIQEARILNPKAIEQKKALVADAVATKEANNEKDMGLANSLEQLALLELGDNNPERAESLIKKALEIEEKHLNKSDPKLACTLMMLGRVYLKKKSPQKAEAIFRSAMLKLSKSPDFQKFAVFNLEDCAKALIQTSNPEEAGAILVDTRMARAVSALSERAFSGELARKADRAIEAYNQKKRMAAKLEEERLAAAKAAAEDDGDAEAEPSAAARTPLASASAVASDIKKNIDRPIRDKWAVIVGISNFKDSSINLHFCAKDAKDFADFLIREKDFAPDHVQLLTDSNATRANILSLLGNKWLPRVAEPDDLVVIYFSSHGSPSSLDVGGVNYLVAHDTDVNDLYATGIAMQDLSRIIKERVHCDRVMILLDACHSGVAAPSSKGLVKAANVNVDSIVQGTGQLVLSSSSPDQRSWESKRYQGSVFTRHLMDGLRKNGKLTKLGDAFSYLSEEVQREVQRDRGVLQNPVMKSKWEGSDLIIGVPPKAPSPGLTDLELPDSPKAAATAKIAVPAKGDKEKHKGAKRVK
ncbi:MAG TPA: tetratricopeptide repeat protein [Candidatus Obscuribacterales bacterium]